jgi:hypothetical protein
MSWEEEAQSLYREMLVAARQQGLSLSRAAVVRIVARFNVVLRELDTLGGEAGKLTRARADALRSQIDGMLASLRDEMARATADGARLTVRRLVELHQDAAASLEHVSQVVGLSSAFDVLSVQAVASLAQRASNAALFKTVMKRHLEDAVPALDQMITSAVARGVSSRTLTNDVARLLSGDDIAYDTYGVGKAEMEGLRSVYADARMIAVSEINNALREANARLLSASRTIEAAKWSLSSAHPKVDACDTLAESDFYGLGPGIYVVSAWPFAPHPHCGCYQAGPIVFRPVAEWFQPRGPIRPLLEEPTIAEPEGMTESGTARAVAVVKTIVEAAHKNPIQ